MLIDFLALMLGLVVLVFAADWFVDGASSLARNFGVSPLLIGLTIVGLGTSAPEILVSSIASFQGNPGLAIGKIGDIATQLAGRRAERVDLRVGRILGL